MRCAHIATYRLPHRRAGQCTEAANVIVERASVRGQVAVLRGVPTLFIEMVRDENEAGKFPVAVFGANGRAMSHVTANTDQAGILAHAEGSKTP